MKKQKLMLGDNISSLKKLPDNSIDSVVTDPPYGLSFMSKKWDYDVPSVEFWKEVYRVLKPGGHILSFGGTRTYHRMVVNIEDAGFEIRDQIQWLYGSGFPKSLNVGKVVDKLEGNEREVIMKNPYVDGNVRSQTGQVSHYECYGKYNIIPLENGLKKGQSEWEGWGSALKPANEPICLARKPLSEKSIAENVLKWRTGGLNIDGCRVQYVNENDLQTIKKKGNKDKDKFSNRDCINGIWGEKNTGYDFNKLPDFGNETGRFPANLILDEAAAEMLDEQSGFLKGDSPNRKPRKGGHRSEYVGTENNKIKNIIIQSKIFDSGGASRFFYVAKVSKAERNMGLDGFEDLDSKKIEFPEKEYVGIDGSIRTNKHTMTKNNHPTVKPVNLMSYLCKLITPPNGIVLDPFMGSGSTGIAALLNDFRFVGMEMDPDYFKIAEARINSYEDYRKFLKK